MQKINTRLKHRTFKNRWIVSVSIILLSITASCSSTQDSVETTELKNWVGTWSTAPQLVEPHNMPPEPGLTGNTLRQVLEVSIGGKQLRMKFSNEFSANPLEIHSVQIAVSEDSSAIAVNTSRMLMFEGQEAVTIPAGKAIFSDPIKFDLNPRMQLAVTIAYGQTPADVTGHPGSRTTSYLLSGHQISPEANFSKAIKTDHWYTINSIEVKSNETTAAVAIIGNSITDGRGSGTNKQNRWPDILSQQLLKNQDTENIGVLNMGIGGNAVLQGGLGPTALDRFDRDILQQNGIKWLIIMEGVNDLGATPDSAAAFKVADGLIAAYEEMIEKAHKKNIKVLGGTITPIKESFYYKEYREQARQKINDWIRTSGKFDGVVDFDKVIRNPENTAVIRENAHDGDHLHPNEYGYELMGKAIDLSLFGETVQKSKAHNPILYADVPDLSMIRVGDTYYMSSTTMHMSPGVPIMKSKDLINWEIVNYVYDTLEDRDALNLENGKNAYGRGSWASSIRYHEDTYYVSTFSSTTGKTYIYTTDDIENGKWKKHSFEPSLHDNTLFFDDDGKVYMIYAAGKLNIVQLKNDLTGVVEGTDQVLIQNASKPAGENIMLGAEGSQVFKINGSYYLFNITWPRGGMRSVVIHRASKIMGPYEGKLALQDKGVAQGGLIDTPEGDWYAYLFRDNGAVGRIPYIVPVKWEDDWPVLGDDGKVPMELDLPANKSLIPNIVNSDEFTRTVTDKKLPLVWQWNHNPQNDLWSLEANNGYLRLTTGRVDTSFVTTQNTLTQRTIGPESTGEILLKLEGMKDGDIAGFGVLQDTYGYVAVKLENGKKTIKMVKDRDGKVTEEIPFNGKEIFFKITCDYKERTDIARFYYSENGETWQEIGEPLKMEYTLGQFMGYRYALFNYATKNPGGYADFDYFRIKETLDE
ncbi:family 43 glycosylhydrolase [Flavimarina sp. Hel_I_48]|uniref:beta-xylosidase family glycoside hydrolase n=1 Tax=Flavimarina sp. Hel_I_48 TaxID=1392488 RepID=UPI0009DD37EC|nr:family 43 glycosylhydrolase [Flavimarina sp. Hel_I_48]